MRRKIVSSDELRVMIHEISRSRRVPLAVAVAGDEALRAAWDACDDWYDIASLGVYTDTKAAFALIDAVNNDIQCTDYYGGEYTPDETWLTRAKREFKCPSVGGLAAAVAAYYRGRA